MIRLDRAEALRYLGYNGQEMDELLQERFERVAHACEACSTPRATHAIFPVDAENSSDKQVVLVGCDVVLAGTAIVQHLQGTQAVALMACTLGAACEREMRRQSALSLTDGVLYDAAASALVEAVANAEEAAVVREASAQGLHANFRFSPGYGDFSLAVQPVFLAALDAPRRIGLSVTEANLLLPSKSITAVVGLFANEISGAMESPSPCISCAFSEGCLLKSQGRTCNE